LKGNIFMYEKKQVVIKSPDVSNLQMVQIDFKTRLYIPIGADPKAARDRYYSRFDKKV